MLYTSTQNEKIKEIKKLQKKKYRDEYGLFLIEGEHLVLEAYKKGLLKELILKENTTCSIPLEPIYVTSSVLSYVSELETPASIMGVCEKKENSFHLGDRILMLDGIQDPGNLGTIIRSAVAFHIDTIILSDDSVDLYNSKVVRASQGLLFHIDIDRKNLIELLPTLKENGYFIWGTKVTGGKSLKSIEKNKKFVIIMGNEGNGMRDDVSGLCDEYLYIDMDASCESLNVGVATSIILYELDK